MFRPCKPDRRVRFLQRAHKMKKTPYSDISRSVKKAQYNSLVMQSWDEIEVRQPVLEDVQYETAEASILKTGDSWYDAFFMVWRGVVSTSHDTVATSLTFEDGCHCKLPLDFFVHFISMNSHSYFGWSSPEAADFFVSHQRPRK